jgi:hypothetical protein
LVEEIGGSVSSNDRAAEFLFAPDRILQNRLYENDGAFDVVKAQQGCTIRLWRSGMMDGAAFVGERRRQQRSVAVRPRGRSNSVAEQRKADPTECKKATDSCRC